VDVEWRGYVIARVRNQETGEIAAVYQRRPGGDWLRWDQEDARVHDRALAATAKRAVAAADLDALSREFHERVKTQAASGKKVRRRALA
jgi:hypothetical protein